MKLNYYYYALFISVVYKMMNNLLKLKIFNYNVLIFGFEIQYCFNTKQFWQGGLSGRCGQLDKHEIE